MPYWVVSAVCGESRGRWEKGSYRFSVVIGVLPFFEPKFDELNGVVNIATEDVVAWCMVRIDGETRNMGFGVVDREGGSYGHILALYKLVGRLVDNL